LTLEQWGSGFDFTMDYTASELLQDRQSEEEVETLVFELIPTVSGLRSLYIGVEPLEWLLVGAGEA